MDREATTIYKNLGDGVAYPSLDGSTGTKAPIKKDGEIGFDVVLNGKWFWHDVSLANEAGDVMFRMEHPASARKSGSDKGKTKSEYAAPGSAGYFSTLIQEIYKSRKGTPEGADPCNNPYPVENSTEK